jgi:signal transduction histidine kinase
MRPSAAPDDAEAPPATEAGSGRSFRDVDPPVRRRSGPHRALVAFLLTAAVGLVLVSAGSAILSQRITRADALADAERTTTRLAQHLVAPLLPGVLEKAPGPTEELQRKVANRMRDRSIKAVLVWNAEGMVLFCSDHTQTGLVVPPTEELLEAIHGHVASDVAPGSEVTFVGEGTQPLLEVYSPITSNGQPLAVEAYFDGAWVERNAAQLRNRIVPLAVGGLCLLQLVQIPVAISLARRARRQDTERTELMALSLEASERERRAIADDVHRGPVPQLARVTSALLSLRNSLPAERQPLVDKLAGAVASAARSLSRLIIDLYPAGRGGPDLVATLENLTFPLREAGVEVTIESAPLPKLSLQTSAAVYRTAKEALTNVAKHAGATHVWVALEPAGDGSAPAVRLCIVDDGVGFPPDALDRRSQGHLGLRLVADRVRDAGGVLELGERPGGGASVTAVFLAVPGA